MLTETKVRAAKAGSKPIKLADSGGMHLLVTPTGGKWWRFDYRFAGKRKTLSLGTYPDVTLKQDGAFVFPSERARSRPMSDQPAMNTG